MTIHLQEFQEYDRIPEIQKIFSGKVNHGRPRYSQVQSGQVRYSQVQPGTVLKRPIMCYIFEKQALWGYQIWGHQLGHDNNRQQSAVLHASVMPFFQKQIFICLLLSVSLSILIPLSAVMVKNILFPIFLAPSLINRCIWGYCHELCTARYCTCASYYTNYYALILIPFIRALISIPNMLSVSKTNDLRRKKWALGKKGKKGDK